MIENLGRRRIRLWAFTVRKGKSMKEDELKPKSSMKLDSSSSRALGILLPAVYVTILLAFCFTYKVWPTPELIAVCFLIYAAYNKWTRCFVRDWGPLVSIFLSYEAMNAVVGRLSGVVHVGQPINAELQLFGSIPTLAFQQGFRSPFLDYLAAFFYSIHFIAPVVFAFLLWKYSSKNYQGYIIALAIGTYSALVTFLFYPVAPPWYGLSTTYNPLWNGPQVVRVLLQMDNHMGSPFYKTIFDYFESNPFAAFPSLHAMYPWIISLYALKIKKTRALPILLFPAGVWFSAVYLGEHYVIDVIGGVAYGTCAFFLAERLIPLAKERWRTLRTTDASNRIINLNQSAR
jgi:membrane-associated phospholipid phosphatase